MTISKHLQTLEKALLFGFLFLFPLIFFPGFNNAFTTAKILLLAIVTGLFLLSKAAKVVIDRKITLTGSNFDTSMFLLVVGYLLSLIIISPNKIEALVDPVRGALLVALFVILILAAPKNKTVVIQASLISLVITLLFSIFSYFGMLSFLPQEWQFINTKGFSFWGNLIAQSVYAGFFLALAFGELREQEKKASSAHPVGSATPLPSAKHTPLASSGVLNLLFIVSLLTLVTSAYVMLKEVKPQFFPLSASWQISVDTLKDSRNALFGVGPANYAALYTRSKPLYINSSPLFWGASVEYSRSAILHIFTEAGLLGLAALVLIGFQLYRSAKKQRFGLPLLVLFISGLLLPMNQAFWMLLFLSIYLLKQDKEPRKFDLKELDLFAYATGLIVIIFVLVAGFFYSRVIASEYYLGQSVLAAQKNQVQQVYDFQARAITSNPYNKAARNAFIQTNLVLANSLAQKKKPNETDQQQYTQLIQQAITNARDAVTLNPFQADAWANLAEVYRYLLGQVKEADAWTIASYQRAIGGDPRNPNYYFNLGTVYYSLGNYDEAIRFFEQAISLKPDIANYYYNLAYAHYQSKNYVKAVNALEATLQYTEKDTDDYKKVKKELNEFRAQLPPDTQKSSEEEKLNPETLSQPETLPTGQPEIELPENSAPPTISLTPEPTPKP